jgi:hypothetical protein
VSALVTALSGGAGGLSVGLMFMRERLARLVQRRRRR